MRRSWGPQAVVAAVIIGAGLVVAGVADAGMVVGGTKPALTAVDPSPTSSAGPTPEHVAPISGHPGVTPAGTRYAAVTGQASKPVKKAYGPKNAQWVSIRRPGGDGPHPAVIFLHGGSWVSGTPVIWDDESIRWADAGWVTVNANYRLGSVKKPTFTQGRNMLDDVTAVLELTRRLKGVDPRSVVVAGDSAGGHLAAWLAGRHRDDVAGLVLWSPVAAPVMTEKAADAWSDQPCDVLCERQRVLAGRATHLFGYSSRIVDPLYYLFRSASPVPTWVAGSSDEWVPWELNGAVLCQAAADRCSAHVVPGVRHGTNLRDSDPPLAEASRQWAGALVGLGAAPTR